MSEEDITFALLVGLPVVAAVSLGLLARALVAGLGGWAWLLWLVILVSSCVIWRYSLGWVP
jgi:hypothetical protein